MGKHVMPQLSTQETPKSLLDSCLNQYEPVKIFLAFLKIMSR